MAYLGNQPALSYTSFAKQDFTTSVTTSYTLDNPVANANELALFINFVRQEPTTAYSASGTSLTLTSATSATDDMYCVFLGKAVQTVNPPNGSVDSSKINYPLTTFSSTGIDDNATSTAITIDSSENVGIGETSPLGKLHVKSADSGGTPNTQYDELVLEQNGNNCGMTILCNSPGDGAIYFGDSADNDIGGIAYSHFDNKMFFKVNGSERMRITSSGLVAINTTSPDTGSITSIDHEGSTFYGLSLNSTTTSGTQYHLRFARGGAGAGYISSNSATTITFNNTSDERLKENIQNSNSAIQDLKDIQVRQFDWKDNIDTHRDFGFVAQELVNVVPEAVTQGTDELDDNGKPVRSWGVDYSHIVPRLVKVCQEQQTKIEELEARITALENK
jgi:hypothetical protein